MSDLAASLPPITLWQELSPSAQRELLRRPAQKDDAARVAAAREIIAEVAPFLKAHGQILVGLDVIGGMLTATILAIFYIPLFFVMVRRGVRDGLAKLRGRPTGHQAQEQGA